MTSASHFLYHSCWSDMIYDNYAIAPPLDAIFVAAGAERKDATNLYISAARAYLLTPTATRQVHRPCVRGGVSDVKATINCYKAEGWPSIGPKTFLRLLCEYIVQFIRLRCTPLSGRPTTTTLSTVSTCSPTRSSASSPSTDKQRSTPATQ